MVRWGKLSFGAATKFKKSSKSANVVLFNYDENDVELGTSAEEKGKIGSKLGTTNNDKYNEVLRPNAMFFDMTVNDLLDLKPTSTIKVIIREFLM